MKAPTYTIGQRVALAFIENEQAPGTYNLRCNDGATYAITWRPRSCYSMQLPRVITLWAEITARRGSHLTLSTPEDMGRLTFRLTTSELAACARELPAAD